MNPKKENGDFAVALRGVTTGYKLGKSAYRVTENISAQIHAGELCCLLGPNGSGKSTLIRTVAGFQYALDGEVRICGESISGHSSPDMSRKLSVVLTERPEVDHMSVRQLVSLGRAPYTGFWGRLSSGDRKIVTEALELTGIEALAEKPIASLSDGERQKALIAKGLAQTTPIIVLDEPTAFLDHGSKVELMLLLRSLTREQGKTVLLSTHDLEIALATGTYFWLLHDNYGFAQGNRGEIESAGLIGKYFDRPGIRYDTSSGSFRIE